MTLLTDEEELHASDGGKIILTNMRIFSQTPEDSNGCAISIFLEKISSIELKRESNPLLGIIGAIAILMGVYLFSNSESEVVPIVTVAGGFIGIILYYLSRKHILSITSDGGRALEFDAQNIGAEEIEKFLLAVQEAKVRRLKQFGVVVCTALHRSAES